MAEDQEARKNASSVTDTDAATGSETDVHSLFELRPGEDVVASERYDIDDGGELLLTNHRLFLRGSLEAKNLFASIRLSEVETVSVVRVPKGRREIYWGIIGLLAALGIWQSLDGVGNLRLVFTGAVVAASLISLLIHFLVSGNVRLVFRSVFGSEITADFSSHRLKAADHFAGLVMARVDAIRPDGKASAC